MQFVLSKRMDYEGLRYSSYGKLKEKLDFVYEIRIMNICGKLLWLHCWQSIFFPLTLVSSLSTEEVSGHLRRTSHLCQPMELFMCPVSTAIFSTEPQKVARVLNSKK